MAATRKEASEMARPVRRVTKEFWGEIKNLIQSYIIFPSYFCSSKGREEDN